MLMFTNCGQYLNFDAINPSQPFSLSLTTSYNFHEIDAHLSAAAQFQTTILSYISHISLSLPSFLLPLTSLSMPWPSNLPAFRLLLAYALNSPSSLLPHTQIPTLLSLPLPLAPSLSNATSLPGQPKIPITIRAIVLDKDNTLCPPNSTALHPAYLLKLSKLRSSPEFSSSPHGILIVSNTAGSTSSPAHEAEAQLLESELQIPVLRQHPQRKKPHCGPDVLEYFTKHGVTDNPLEIAVVGDRLATDVLLAREMGSWSVWVRDGWRNPEMQGRDYRGWMSRMEGRMERILQGGLMYKAPLPRGFASRRGGGEKV